MIFTLRGRIGVGLGIFLGIICFFYWGFYNPQAKLIEKMNRQVKRENLKLVQIKKKVVEYEKLKEKYQAMALKLASLENYLVKEEESFSVFQELGLMSRKYGIDFVEIVPEEAIGGQYYNRIPVRIELFSTYHALGMLLSDMDKKGRMIGLGVDGIKMRGVEKGGESLEEQKNHTVEVDLLLSLYTLKAESTAEKTPQVSSSQSAEKTQKSQDNRLRRSRGREG
ncbi:MAG: type 4a pilus biogenesis protein PilO [bacterium]